MTAGHNQRYSTSWPDIQLGEAKCVLSRRLLLKIEALTVLAVTLIEAALDSNMSMEPWRTKVSP